MRAVVQRVSSASVEVEGTAPSAIDGGLLVYLGAGSDDGDADVTYLADKVRHLRIFADEQGRLNLDVVQADGSVLVVSAFTVLADARRGRRPSFESAADANRAIGLYDGFCEQLSRLGVRVERGTFGEDMDVHSVNAGPVCILLDSRRVF